VTLGAAAGADTLYIGLCTGKTKKGLM